MRRKDREITDGSLIDEIIKKCSCCRLGFVDEGKVYIVPMNFGFVSSEKGRIFYFHSASQGRKLDLIRKNGIAGFELDTGHELKIGEIPCSCSYLYQSIIGEGKVSIIEEESEKIRGLNEIMEQYTGQSKNEFSQAALEKTTVFKLEVTEISCKVH